MICSNFYPNGSIVEAKNNYLTALELEKNGYSVDVCTFESDGAQPDFVTHLVKKRTRVTFGKYYPHFRRLIRFPLCPISFSDVSVFLKTLSNIDMTIYDYVYTIFGGGSEHIVGQLLKERNPHLKHIAEFRDPWVHNKIAKAYFFDNSNKWYGRIVWKMLMNKQRKLLDQVDMLLVESEGHANNIKRDFAYESDIFICNGFSNIYDICSIDINLNFPNQPVFGFVGSTYYGYEDVIQRFLDVLKELQDEGYEFTLISVGDNYFSRVCKRSEIKNFFAFAKVSYKRSLGFIKKIDIGLAIISEDYDTINSKIFEHMQFGKYTLAISPKNGVMDRMLRGANAGHSISYDRMEMKEHLKAIIENESIPKVKECDVIKYSRSNMFSSIIQELDKI